MGLFHLAGSVHRGAIEQNGHGHVARRAGRDLLVEARAADAARRGGFAPFVAFGLALGGVTVWLERSQVGAEGAEWSYSVVERVPDCGPRALVLRRQACMAESHNLLLPAVGDRRPGAVAIPVSSRGRGGDCRLVAVRTQIGRGPLAAVLIFAGVLAPALGFFNVYPFRYSFVADHFQYHACIALVALFAAAATLAARRFAAQRRNGFRRLPPWPCSRRWPSWHTKKRTRTRTCSHSTTTSWP